MVHVPLGADEAFRGRSEAGLFGVVIRSILDGDPGATPRQRFLLFYDGQLRGGREGRWKRVYKHRARSYEGVTPGMDGVSGPYAFPVFPSALYDLELTSAKRRMCPKTIQRWWRGWMPLPKKPEQPLGIAFRACRGPR
jgi:hypothetical protein